MAAPLPSSSWLLPFLRAFSRADEAVRPIICHGSLGVKGLAARNRCMMPPVSSYIIKHVRVLCRQWYLAYAYFDIDRLEREAQELVAREEAEGATPEPESPMP